MPERTIRIFDHEITRRDALKAGGIAGLGLAFSSPVISRFRPKAAFAQVGDGCTPALEIGEIAVSGDGQVINDTLHVVFDGTNNLSISSVDARCASCGYEPCEDSVAYLWEVTGLFSFAYLLQNETTATPSISCSSGSQAELKVTVTLRCFSPGCGSSTADATATIGLQCVD